MKYFINILSFLILCSYVIASEGEFDPNPKLRTVFSDRGPIHDEEGYLQMPSYSFIQPNFVQAVLASSGQETLEICAGQGFVLQDILEQQTVSSPEVCYTVVEYSLQNLELLKQRYLSSRKKGTKTELRCACSDVVSFLNAHVRKNRAKFDLVFGGFALHILYALQYVETLNGLFQVMKEGGRLFLTQHGLRKGKYSQGYVSSVENGSLLPFWSDGKFYSDQHTMATMLQVFGFEIEKIEQYCDTHLESQLSTYYLGIIARKNSALRKVTRIKEYFKAAEEMDIHWLGGDIHGCDVRVTYRNPANLWEVDDPKIDCDRFCALKAECVVLPKNQGVLIKSLDFSPNNGSQLRASTSLMQKLREHHQDLRIYVWWVGFKDKECLSKDNLYLLLTQSFELVEDITPLTICKPKEPYLQFYVAPEKGFCRIC